jgi:hypothetical protein
LYWVGKIECKSIIQFEEAQRSTGKDEPAKNPCHADEIHLADWFQKPGINSKQVAWEIGHDHVKVRV